MGIHMNKYISLAVVNIIIAMLAVSSAYAQGVQQLVVSPQVDSIRKASEQGNADGQYALGNEYHNGNILDKNDKEAVKWWMKSAEQGKASVFIP